MTQVATPPAFPTELRLRGTFIDVAPSAVKLERRSRSHSTSRVHSAHQDIFSPEREYIKSLSEHQDDFSFIGAEPTVTKLTAENVGLFHEKPTKGNRINTTSFLSASTTASTPPTSADGISGCFEGLDVSDDESESTPTPPTAPHKRKSSNKAKIDWAGIRDNGSSTCTPSVFLNRGSHGHPELCMKPCIFYAAGHCEIGDDCGYCHFKHDNRPLHVKHLYKRNRLALKKLNFRDCLTLLLPLLVSRADAIGIDASELLNALAVEHPSGIAAPALGGVLSAKTHQALTKAFGSMNFLSVVSVLLNRPDAPASLKGDEIWVVINRLRNTCPMGVLME